MTLQSWNERLINDKYIGPTVMRTYCCETKARDEKDKNRSIKETLTTI
jgi:hypothetical protein